MGLMNFCSKCNNILYPKVDREQKTLLFACRHCDHEEVANNRCLYMKKIDHSEGETNQGSKDRAMDPTLPRTKSKRCTQCGHGEATFQPGPIRTEEGMTLFFRCCNPNCGHRWRD